MKKIIVLSTLSTLMLLAYEAEVKKADVTLLINQEAKEYKVGSKIALNQKDVVCFQSGKGKVLITGKDGYKKQLSKRVKSCKILPGDANATNGSLVDGIKNGVLSFVATAKEEAKAGASRKGSETKIFTKDIEVDSKSKYALIINNKWALPVKMKIVNKDGKAIDTMVNEDEDTTLFALSIAELKSGYTIKVIDGWNKVVINSKVKLK